MATVSHYAMRRYPVGPGDGPNQLGSNQYYVGQNQQLSPMYDKSKKTWSQRLKITKAEKNSPPSNQPHPLSITEHPDYTQSALSRSMKYAEPWLYGTVRGIPARPVHGQAIFTPMPAEVAVVVCSCPEFLNGTKKEMKKASICKKCKGSRLPLAPIGGTVRIRSTTAPVIHKPRGSVGTVRLPQSSSIKSRPSILDTQNDPYDLMRRTRLLSPEPTKPSKIVVDKPSIRNRAKSTSPSRGRSRNRIVSSQPDDDQLSSKSNRSHSASRSKQEHWLDTFEPDRGGRRSILRCDVNPYDLISNNSNKHNNEFSPDHDDDHSEILFEACLRRSGPAGKGSMKLNYANVKAIAGQRISLGETAASSSLITQNGENFIYDSVAVTSKNNNSNSNNNNNNNNNNNQQNNNNALKLVHDTKQKHLSPPQNQDQKTTKSQPQQLQLQRKSGQLFQEKQHHNSQKASHLIDVGQHQGKPKRPPRRKHETNSADDDDNEVPEVTSTKLITIQSPSNNTTTKNDYKLAHGGVLSHMSTEMVTSQKLGGIKSILKRPSSVTSSMSSSSDIDTKYNNINNMINTNDVRNDNVNNINDGNNKIGNGEDLSKYNNEKIGKAQFYLPLPTRKKVQFMVEDKIIHDEHEDEVLLNDGVLSQDNKFKSNDIRNPEYKGSNNLLDQQKQQEILEILQQKKQHYEQKQIHDSGNNNNQQKQQYQQLAPKFHSQIDNKTITKTTTNGNNSKDLMIPNSNQDSFKMTKGNVSENRVVIVHPNTTKSNGNLKINQQNLNNDSNVRNSSKVPVSDDSTTKNSTNPITSSKSSALRRTYSDRRSNMTTIILNFNDTMALRIKNNRVDSRDIFPNDGQQISSSNTQVQQSSTSKPSSSLSLPLSSATTITKNKIQTTTTKTQTSQVTDDNNMPAKGLVQHLVSQPQPSRPPRQTINKKLSWQEDQNDIVMIKNEANNPSTKDGNSKDELDDKENSHESNESNFYEDYSFDTKTIDNDNIGSSKVNNNNKNNNSSSINMKDDKEKLSRGNQQQQQQQQQQQNHLHNINHEEYVQKNDKNMILLGQKEIFNGTRLFGNPNNGNINNKIQSQKTVVRVAPFNKQTSEIHRLKIKHEDVNQFDNNISSKKTSILINGDDCYSTVNVNNNTPIYQSSVVVTDGTLKSPSPPNNLKVTTSNTVTINVSSPIRTPEEELIYKNNKINTLLSLNSVKSVIPIGGNCDDNVSITNNNKNLSLEDDSKRGRTFITLDYDNNIEKKSLPPSKCQNEIISHEEELVKILRNPVEAVRRNLVPHVCGKTNNDIIMKNQIINDNETIKYDRNSFIGKLLEDPMLNQLAEGLDSEVVAKLIENSLKRLKESRTNVDTTGTKDNDDMTKMIDISLQKIKEERLRLEANKNSSSIDDQQQKSDENGNRDSVSSGNSFSSANYELFDFDNNESDCYQSCSSEFTGDDDVNSTRSKFYQMLVDATLSEIEISATIEDDHHYESIRMNGDPIYEEISEVPPPLPLSPPPMIDPELDKKNTRSMFEGASKYDILSYLVDAKERGIVREETYEYNFSNTSDVIVEEEVDTLSDLNKTKQISDVSSRISSHLSIASDSSEDTSLTSSLISNNNINTNNNNHNNNSNSNNNDISNKINLQRKPTSDIERNDSGVGSETSKSSRSKYQNPSGSILNKNSPIHLCEDCDGPVETQITDSGVMYAPLVCRKCGKKRAERKEIITEIVETEEKYGRDLQIILEEFCQPMLVAGLLTQEQLSAIFLNTEELLENNQTLAERMRDALDISMEQGDDDLLTLNVGKIFLEATPMLHAFESYCVRQAAASLLLANLEKEKELLRIFLRVSQMENTVLRRMNLNSFLMVPVQRVTKYPLLLARLYKVTPQHLDGRELLKQAQEKIELHLNHMNQEAKDVPTKLWRRISSSSPNRRSSCEIDMINIKLRKMAIDILEWNHDEVRFTLEGKLLFTQPTDSNWKKGRTIKLTPVNALLVTNGKPSANYKAEKALSDELNFPKHTGIREASLLLVKEKCGRYTLIREPLYLDRCVICTEADWDDYFEVHELSSKDTFIFKAEDGVRTKQWYTQLQYHAQGMGAWRKRRNALANIMINGMLSRT